MGIIKRLLDNYELKQDKEYLELRVAATEQLLSERNQAYRQVVGEKEELKEKAELLDRSLTNLNKTLNQIIEVAESNDYNNNKIKIKKILELARYETNKF